MAYQLESNSIPYNFQARGTLLQLSEDEASPVSRNSSWPVDMESLHCESMHSGFELALEPVVPIVIFITSLSQEPITSDYVESLVEKKSCIPWSTTKSSRVGYNDISCFWMSKTGAIESDCSRGTLFSVSHNWQFRIMFPWRHFLKQHANKRKTKSDSTVISFYVYFRNLFVKWWS